MKLLRGPASALTLACRTESAMKRRETIKLGRVEGVEVYSKGRPDIQYFDCLKGSRMVSMAERPQPSVT